MMKNYDITAVIPVREGSRRLKNKNVAPFAGTNLLLNKIEQLKEVNMANNMKTFEIDRITFFDECPDSISDAEFLNKRIRKLRYFLEDACPSRLLNGLKYELYFFESEKLDAQAFKRDSENYVIAFSTGTIKIIWEKLNTIFKEKTLLDLFNIEICDKNTIDFTVRAVFDYMTYFIALHELFHIVNGHCDYLTKEGIACSENWVIHDEKKNLTSQILEANADISAAKILARYTFLISYNHLEDKTKREEMLPMFFFEIKSMYFAIYNLFLLFSHEYEDSFKDCLENMLFYDHPFSSIRMVYTLNKSIQELSAFLKDDEIPFLLNDILKTCIAYDRIFYAHNDFAHALQAIAYTKAGASHILKLHNGWNSIYKDFQKFAFYKLDKNEHLEEMPYWVDEAGNMQILLKQVKGD